MTPILAIDLQSSNLKITILYQINLPHLAHLQAHTHVEHIHMQRVNTKKEKSVTTKSNNFDLFVKKKRKEFTFTILSMITIGSVGESPKKQINRGSIFYVQWSDLCHVYLECVY